MYWDDANRRAITMLRDAYRQKVELLAEELRPRIDSGELMPWGPWDDRWEGLPRHALAPIDVLWDVCKHALARTRQQAHLVLAVSPHGEEADDEERGATVDPRHIASVAVALDVLKIAAPDWYAQRHAPRPAHQEAR